MSNKRGWETSMLRFGYSTEEIKAIDDLVWEYIEDRGGYANELRATIYGYAFGIDHQAPLQELREFLWIEEEN